MKWDVALRADKIVTRTVREPGSRIGPWLAAVFMVLSVGNSASAGIRVAALDRSVAPSADAAPDLPWDAVVRRVQDELSKMGLYDGPRDGRFNARLEAALRRFERKYGIIERGKTLPEALERIKSLSAALHLQRDLLEARRKDVARAAKALRGNLATRDLLEPPELLPETAGSTKSGGGKQCQSEITVRCLLGEALQSVGRIEADSYRDWALRDVVKAHVRTGNFDAVRDTLRRISDPRLILVALREVAGTMARHGHTAEAGALAGTIPDIAQRARAFAAIAVARAANDDPKGAAAYSRRTLALLDDEPPHPETVAIATKLGSGLAAADEIGLARDVVQFAREFSSPRRARMVRLSELGMIATAQSEVGQVEAVMETLSRFDGGVGASGGAVPPRDGAAEAARYRVVAFCNLAVRRARSGDRREAENLLAKATEAAKHLRRGYATAFARARIAEAWMHMRAFDTAAAVGREIDNAALRARLLWSLSAARTDAGDPTAARAAQKDALDATKAVPSGFERAAILSDGALMLARRGAASAARRLFRQALADGDGITVPWWRARTYARLAATLSGLNRLQPAADGGAGRVK